MSGSEIDVKHEKQPFPILLDERERDGLKNLADQWGISRAGVLRLLLRRELDKQEQEPAAA
jgi:hypothetical protein